MFNERVVSGKLGEREQEPAVVLLVFDIVAEVLFQDGVDALCPAVCLGVEGGGELSFDLHGVAQRFPGVQGDRRAAVGDDTVGNAVKLPDMGDIYLTDVQACSHVSAWDVVGHFGETIDDYEASIEAMRFGEAGDEVHRNR